MKKEAKIKYCEFKLQRIKVCESPAAANCCTPSEVVDLFNNGPRNAGWFDETKECLVVFTLNTKLKCTGFFLIGLGSINECTARISEILRPAVIHNCHSIILSHIHPSNCCLPSQADIELTRRLNEASRIMGIRLQDHVIVGGSDTKVYKSFREMGLL